MQQQAKILRRSAFGSLVRDSFRTFLELYGDDPNFADSRETAERMTRTELEDMPVAMKEMLLDHLEELLGVLVLHSPDPVPFAAHLRRVRFFRSSGPLAVSLESDEESP